MSDRKAAIIDTLTQSRAKLRTLLSGLQSEDWDKQIQDADQLWSVRQFLLHLVESQRGMTGQLVNISAGQDSIPPDFDLDRWNKRTVEKGAEKTPQELIAALEEGHEKLKEVVQNLPEESLDNRGRHASLKIMSVEEIATLIGTHEAEHTQLIADKLGVKI